MPLEIKINCPLCKAKIPSDALRCSHCTGDLTTKEIREKITKQTSRNKKATIILIVIFVIVLVWSISSLSKNPPSPPMSSSPETADIGFEGMVNANSNKNDCKNSTILAITKEAQDKILKAVNAKDDIGLSQLLLTGEAFMVSNCTKIKVIDRSMFLRQVRVLEGEQFGKAGWMPYEWVK